MGRSVDALRHTTNLSHVMLFVGMDFHSRSCLLSFQIKIRYVFSALYVYRLNYATKIQRDRLFENEFDSLV